MSAPDILAVARWLQAGHGLHIFAVDHPGLPQCVGAHRPERPCDGKRGKHPVGRWSRDATNDPAVIEQKLRRGLRNLGIACGPSGLLVVDEDRAGAFAGYAAEVGEQLPETFTVETSKGHHFYFRAPEASKLGNGVGALAGRGIDIRGRGGFVVAPGSVHETGILYRPVSRSGAEILPAPDWLLSALQTRPVPARKAPSARPRAGRRSGGKPFRVLTSLVQTVLDAREGERNNLLFWAACRAGEHAAAGLFDLPAARAALLDAARHIGLPEGEAIETFDSAELRTTGKVTAW